jgi:hypothetical protein
MTTGPVEDVLRAFATADLDGWSGLPDLTLDVVAAHLPVAADVSGRGRLGSDRRPASWVAIDSHRFELGLRGWVDETDRVLLLEGRHPVSDDNQPLSVPDLGDPDLTLPVRLGRLTLDEAEWVYATRGLAVQVNPDNGLLLGLLAFGPTTATTYVSRLRPQHAAAPRPTVQTHRSGGLE